MSSCATFSGMSNVNQVWNGKNASNAFVADGVYTATLTYIDEAGNLGAPVNKAVTGEQHITRAWERLHSPTSEHSRFLQKSAPHLTWKLIGPMISPKGS